MKNHQFFLKNTVASYLFSVKQYFNNYSELSEKNLKNIRFG